MQNLLFIASVQHSLFNIYQRMDFHLLTLLSFTIPFLSPFLFLFPAHLLCIKIMHVYIGSYYGWNPLPLRKSRAAAKKQSWILLSVLICFVFVHFYCNVFSIVFTFGHVLARLLTYYAICVSDSKKKTTTNIQLHTHFLHFITLHCAERSDSFPTS